MLQATLKKKKKKVYTTFTSHSSFSARFESRHALLPIESGLPGTTKHCLLPPTRLLWHSLCVCAREGRPESIGHVTVLITLTVAGVFRDSPCTQTHIETYTLHFVNSENLKSYLKALDSVEGVNT